MQNTESFDPASTMFPAMRIRVCSNNLLGVNLTDDEVAAMHYCWSHDAYQQLVEEISIWKLWHGGCHSVAEEPEKSPTFCSIVEKVCSVFQLDPSKICKRINRYQGDSDWKPIHQDAAAFNPALAASQNVSIVVSFGREREITLMNSKDRIQINFRQSSGMLLSFGRDVNMHWKHGVSAALEGESGSHGRIYIAIWVILCVVVTLAALQWHRLIALHLHMTYAATPPAPKS
jgi:hypothetical protein